MQTLQEAKDYLKDNWEKGVECPCCKQTVKLYKRKMTSATGIVMIKISKADKDDQGYVHLPPILDNLKGTAHQGGYATLAHHWGLIEPMMALRDDGSNRVGYWRLTPAGQDFVEGKTTVARYAKIYNNHCYGLQGDQVGIREVLGNKFSYRELMGS